MDQFYSILSSWWRVPAESLKLDIIAALPIEIALIILRLLDPRSLLAAILVNRGWLRLVRSDVVLRNRVHDELRRERRAYWDLVDGDGSHHLANRILENVYFRRPHTASLPRHVRSKPVQVRSKPVVADVPPALDEVIVEPLSLFEPIADGRLPEHRPTDSPSGPLATSTPVNHRPAPVPVPVSRNGPLATSTPRVPGAVEYVEPLRVQPPGARPPAPSSLPEQSDHLAAPSSMPRQSNRLPTPPTSTASRHDRTNKAPRHRQARKVCNRPNPLRSKCIRL